MGLLKCPFSKVSLLRADLKFETSPLQECFVEKEVNWGAAGVLSYI